MTEIYQHTIDASLFTTIGKAGVADKGITILSEKAQTAFAKILANKLPLFEQLSDPYLLTSLEKHANKILQSFSHIVLLGTGGSSLNAQSFLGLKQLPQIVSSPPHIHVVDNIDPNTLVPLLSHLPLKDTHVIATSKSGSTLETLTQTMLFIDALQNANIDNIGEHVTLITESTDNPFHQLGKAIGAHFIEHPADIGGRYASFTAVGLLPALLAGLSATDFIKGASTILDQCKIGDNKAAPLIGAALSVSLMQHHYPISVMMTYADQLRAFSHWYCQLWAESLGKKRQGTTPIAAKGSQDQHSQLQLYLDGPHDKSFIMITEGSKETLSIAQKLEGKMSYLTGAKLSDIFRASSSATMASLKKHRSPVRHIHVPTLNETALGALHMHFMIETIVTAHMLSINPFNQPAVEDGKIHTTSILQKDSHAH